MKMIPTFIISRGLLHHSEMASSARSNGNDGDGEGDGKVEGDFQGWILCWWMHRHSEFRLPELQALAASIAAQEEQIFSNASSSSSTAAAAHLLQRAEPLDACDVLSPFWRLSLAQGAHMRTFAREVCKRAQLVRGLYEVLATGDSLDALIENLQTLAATPGFDARFRKGADAARRSWKLHVTSFGGSIPRASQFEMMKRFAFVDLPGPVRMDAPDVQLCIIQDASGSMPMGPMPTSASGAASTTPSSTLDASKDEMVLPLSSASVTAAQKRERWFFAIELGNTEAPRRAMANLTLSRRKFIGPTSMDPEMSFIMCNHACVSRGSFVFDPFVGTGSILVAAAHVGAFTVGMDIDIRMLLSKDVGVNRKAHDMWDNFNEYQLQQPFGLVRGDVSRPPYRNVCGGGGSGDGFFDAVVCDPPYGVRAGGRKCGGRTRDKDGNLPYTIDPELRENHIPSTAPYPIGECYLDLLDIAARMLRLGGRLTYFVPCCISLYDDAQDMPSHPMLRVVSNCEQILSSYHSRRLITMEKHCVYDEVGAREHRHRIESALGARLEKHADELESIRMMQSKMKAATSEENNKVGGPTRKRREIIREHMQGDHGSHRSKTF